MGSTNQGFNPETIEVISRPGQGACAPVVGPECLALLDHLNLDEVSRNRLRDEALAVLAQCGAPTSGMNRRTGLVIGYVQSGKTMSFTTVAALARDNSYQIVIVITGVSVPLFEQSKRRLQNDLRLLTRPDRRWQHFSNPSLRGSDQRTMADTLAEWRDQSVPESERKTILITVMKNHKHLDNLGQVLTGLDLRGVPTLVVDDEADQAGLNTLVAQGAESTTYRRLLAVRDRLPQHSFLQYTATPQAPLLINLIDVLSPNFAELLTPGPEYVGGRELFLSHPNLIRTIPASQIPTQNDQITEPPDSLLEAMRVFFLGVAAGLVLTGEIGNRSMMLHPSQLRTGHSQYFHWVTQVRENWNRLLELSAENPDRLELLEEFRTAFDDLKSTVENLPSFDMLAGRLHHAIRRTRVEEVNSRRGRTPQIDWSATYPFILVGGQAMDRGFTVEGLTVTYMPRSLGVGNADTVQQRARFFGYKRSYLGFCRVFLENGVRDAYRHYVEHEEDVRNRLSDHRETGRPLSEWKRAFFLNRALQPTRNNVLLLDYMQDTVSDDWYTPKAPHDSDEATQWNREIVNQFIGRVSLEDDEGHPRRTEMQKHKIATGVSLREAYEELLTRLRVTQARDSQRFTGVLLQIGAYLENHLEATCTIYVMSAGAPRERSVDGSNEIPTLFQGSNPGVENGNPVTTYPGDSEIRLSPGLTIQIHNLNVSNANQGQLAGNVPAIAVWVPGEMAADWVSQNQGGS